MLIGRLNRYVTIQESTMMQLPSGEPVLTWTTLCLRRSAQRRDLKGEERNIPAEKVAYEQVVFRIRYSRDVEDLSPNSRIIYPALTQSEENDQDFAVENRRVYDVLSIAEFDDGNGLDITTQRRSDVS